MHDDLIARLEAATGPCRELDAMIRQAVYCPQGYVEQSPINGAWCVYDGTTERGGRARIFEGKGKGLAFTASIDAALTLVPEGCLYFARTLWDEGKTAGMAVVHCYRSEGSALFWQEDHTGIAATPALAICIAALKAKVGGEG